MPLRILILDDSPDDAALVARQLAALGEPFELRTAVSREEFEREVASRDFDLVLADFSLPQFTGLEALRILRDAGSEVPFILVSGTIGEEAAAGAIRAGADDYVLKDNLLRLAHAAERALADARGRRQRREAEAALRERDRLYRTVIEQAYEGIAILDDEGRILEANRQAFALVGRDPGQGIPELTDLFLEEDLREDPFEWSDLRAGRAVVKRRRLRRSDGTLLPVDVTAKRVDEVFVVVCRDASQRERAEREIERHRAMDASLAEISRQAIAATDTQPVFDAAVALVARTLGATFVSILEYRPAKPDVVLRAGVGFTEAERAAFPIPADGNSLVAFTLRNREPVQVDDWNDETRCEPRFLRQLGVRSSLSIIIGPPERPFGVLGTHSRSPGAFGASEALFVRSIANVLGDFVTRLQTETRYRTLIETTLEGVWMADADGRATFVNRRLGEIVGESADRILGRPLVEFIDESEHERRAATIDAWRRAGSPPGGVRPRPWDLSVQHEVRLRRADGTPLWVLASSSPLYSEEGSYIGSVGMVADIDDRKRAEEALAAHVSQQTAVAELGKRAITETDLAALFRSASEALAVGLRGAIPSIAPVEERPEWPNGWCPLHGEDSLCESIGAEGREVVLLHVDERGRPDRSSSDAPFVRTVANILTDAAERMRYDQELAEHRSALAAAQRIAQVGSWRWNFATGEVFWSAEAYRIFGVVADQFRPSVEGFLGFVPPEDRGRVAALLDEFAAAGAGEGSLSFDARIVDAAGAEQWIHVHSEPNAGDRERLEVRGIVQNISERKRAEEERFRREQEFETIVEAAPDVIARFDRQHRHIYVSPAIRRFSGREPAEFLGKTNLELGMPPGVCEPIAAAVESVFLSGRACSIGFGFDGNGERFWFHARFVPQFSRSGAVEAVLSIARDVSELKVVEQRLARAQRIARIGSWEWDLATGSVAWSDETYELFERSRERFRPTAEAVFEQIDPRDREAVDAAARRLATGESPEEVLTARLPLAIGSERVLEIHGQPIRSSDGRITGLTGTLQDVTERLQAERRLRESEERYRGLVEHARDAIYTVSLDGRFESINAAATAITGWSAQELVGTPFAALVHPDDLGFVQHQFARVLGGEDAEPATIRVLRKDGRYVRIDTTAAPVVSGGALSGVFGIGRDITEREEAAAERERLTRRIQLLLESSSDGILADDTLGRCTLVNSAACRILGLDPGEVVGRNLHEILHRGSTAPPHSDEDCPLRRVAITRKPLQLEHELFVRHDGTPVPVEVSIAPMIEGGALVGTVVTFRDVTERLALQEELERANRLTSLGRLAATMAHEFNNVLMGIQPFAEIIQRNAPDESFTKAARQILRSLQRGRGVTADILRFTRKAEPATRAVDLRTWLDELLPELRTIVTQNIELELAAADPGMVVEADEALLAQVLTNLVANARDSMPAGGTIRIETRRCSIGERFRFGSVPAPHRHVHLAVRDTGQGIPPEILSSIFEPFFTTKKKGTGLGLAVAAQIVAAHQGKIFVESEVGGGTSFHLFLPLAETAAVAHTAAKSRDSFPASVLIVEDDEDVATGLVALLADLGVKTRVAPTGRDAIDALASGVPDAVILDVRLPDASGTDVYAEIDRRYPSLPVLFSTGHANPRELEHVLSKRHVAFLMKPYESEALIEALRETCSAQTSSRG